VFRSVGHLDDEFENGGIEDVEGWSPKSEIIVGRRDVVGEDGESRERN